MGMFGALIEAAVLETYSRSIKMINRVDLKQALLDNIH